MWLDQQQELLGSVLRITFESKDQPLAEKLLQETWDFLRQFQQKYSRFLTGNTLEQINSHLHEWQETDEETFKHLSFVENFLQKYPLHFSLGVKKSLEKLGYDATYSFVEQPETSEEHATKKSTQTPDSATTSFNPLAQFQLQPPNKIFLTQPIEFGGFGKGYALEWTANNLKPHASNICLDFGGDLYARGKNPEGKPWKMALESPIRLDEFIGTIEIDDQYLAASNTLKRRWGKKKQFHHLIDPATGQPANYWIASYVLSNSGTEADMLATALFCTPANELNQLSQQLQNLQFMLVSPENQAFNHNFPAQLH